MSVVLDASLLVVLHSTTNARHWARRRCASGRPPARRCTHPRCFPMGPLTNALVRAAVAGGLEPGVVAEIWATISAVPITLHPLEAGVEVIAIAQRLGRQSAYDAAYIGLAQSVDADLWTLDGPLARNARSIGLPVQLLGPHSGPT